MEAMSNSTLALSFVGFFSLSKASFSLLKWIYSTFLRPSKDLHQYGSWAIITGSTDGIGKSLAFEIASKGLNLVLIGRNPSKLESTTAEIRQKENDKIEIKSIVIDFAKSSGNEISEAVEEGIKGLDIGILINNAGVSYPHAKFHHEVDLEVLESLIRVNVDAMSLVTRSVIPLMLKKKKGAIVNIGSGATLGFPLFSAYAGSKGYVATFSQSMAVEYKRQGIDIQCQIPMLVASKMTKLRPSFFVPSSEAYSKVSVKCIGLDPFCIPYWVHSIQWWLTEAIPAWLYDHLILEYFLGMRKRGLAKDARQTKAN